MTGRLFIDGKDAYPEYRVFVHEGGYNEMISFPGLKEVESVDWPDMDGIEADLADPVLDMKEFTITFGCTDNDRLFAFFNMLADGAYHDFDFAAIGHTARLRMVSINDKNSFKRLERFTLQFADDSPGRPAVRPEAAGYVSTGYQGYGLNGRDMSDYGISILQGTQDEILKAPAVKASLLTGNSATPGMEYDGEKVVFQAKEVQLKCLIRAVDTDAFWRNYNALLFDLTVPGVMGLYYYRLDEEYPCFYKGMSVSRFNVGPAGDVWCEFTLTLMFTSFRIGMLECLLASEDGKYIITQDDEYFIDMKNYGN